MLYNHGVVNRIVFYAPHYNKVNITTGSRVLYVIIKLMGWSIIQRTM